MAAILEVGFGVSALTVLKLTNTEGTLASDLQLTFQNYNIRATDVDSIQGYVNMRREIIYLLIELLLISDEMLWSKFPQFLGAASVFLLQ